jgi:hypothetical protein
MNSEQLQDLAGCKMTDTWIPATREAAGYYASEGPPLTQSDLRASRQLQDAAIAELREQVADLREALHPLRARVAALEAAHTYHLLPAPDAADEPGDSGYTPREINAALAEIYVTPVHIADFALATGVYLAAVNNLIGNPPYAGEA